MSAKHKRFTYAKALRAISLEQPSALSRCTRRLMIVLQSSIKIL